MKIYKFEIIHIMITQESDPLRFIKPRKKQFHLTPTKPSKSKPL